jgi:2,4-dienoyl-CoA reductase-like NADH-dependent reductase (Old Yellow Enzyme family)
MNIGQIEIKNRFVRSGTAVMRATEDGEVTNELISYYNTLAKGGVGLIITGYTGISRVGKSADYLLAIHNDKHISGLQKLTDTIHQQKSKVVIQLVHCGMVGVKKILGQKAFAPTNKPKNPYDTSKPQKMSEEDIENTILDFKEAARRSIEAGADGIQIHAGHTYLINQFLSPFFNNRDDSWGGTDENQFRFLKEIITEIKDFYPQDKILLLKLNSHDHCPEKGIDFELAAKYSKWLVDLGVDAIEISCGSAVFSPYETVRGRVPVNESLEYLKAWQKPIAKRITKKFVGKQQFENPYNFEAAKVIKPVLGDVPLILVGGIRKTAEMEEMIENKNTDFISMSRPFIREPNLVKKIQENKDYQSKCVSCNNCSAALTAAFAGYQVPIRCYNKDFPKKKDYQMMNLTA